MGEYVLPFSYQHRQYRWRNHFFNNLKSEALEEIIENRRHLNKEFNEWTALLNWASFLCNGLFFNCVVIYMPVNLHILTQAPSTFSMHLPFWVTSYYNSFGTRQIKAVEAILIHPKYAVQVFFLKKITGCMMDLYLWMKLFAHLILLFQGAWESRARRKDGWKKSKLTMMKRMRWLPLGKCRGDIREARRSSKGWILKLFYQEKIPMLL